MLCFQPSSLRSVINISRVSSSFQQYSDVLPISVRPVMQSLPRSQMMRIWSLFSYDDDNMMTRIATEESRLFHVMLLMRSYLGRRISSVCCNFPSTDHISAFLSLLYNAEKHTNLVRTNQTQNRTLEMKESTHTSKKRMVLGFEIRLTCSLYTYTPRKTIICKISLTASFGFIEEKELLKVTFWWEFENTRESNWFKSRSGFLKIESY